LIIAGQMFSVFYRVFDPLALISIFSGSGGLNRMGTTLHLKAPLCTNFTFLFIASLRCAGAVNWIGFYWSEFPIS